MRLFDIAISLSILIIVLPIVLPIMAILRMTGEREVFYTQERVGYGGQKFKLLKFATMLKDSPNMGAGTLTMKDDPRVLPFGRVLRKTKINELPQIFNILRGDMALVGPRPLVPDGERLYTAEAATTIRSVRPGLTGVGSILLRDEEALYAHRPDAKEFYKNVIQPYKESVEIYYVERRSLALDLKIILLTVFAVMKPNINLEHYFPGVPQREQFQR